MEILRRKNPPLVPANELSELRAVMQRAEVESTVLRGGKQPAVELVDRALLCETECVRYQADFSSAHWLYQVIAIYETGLRSDLRRAAFEAVMRCAKNVGCVAAVKLAATYPAAARFPMFLPDLEPDETLWNETRQGVLADFDAHLRNRFYRREGD